MAALNDQDENMRASQIFAANQMKITKLKVKKGQKISKGSLLCFYKDVNDVLQRFKSNEIGTITEIFVKNGDDVVAGSALFDWEECRHPTVMKDMCADCGADLRVENSTAGNRKEEVSASVAMVHSIPELIVSEQLAKELGKADEDRLLKTRKLVLLVDLDQTLIHTTNDNIPANLKDVHHYQLWHGQQLLWYHTRLRPQTQTFLENISTMFELHICTFGSRMYAHTIAKIIDPEGKYFSHRILSRDECFNAQAKTANLKALFPNGDAMVCIIDDREDVWHFSPNLIHVKPYRFFQGTADINAPPGLTKTEQDSEPMVHRVRKVSVSSTGSSEDKTEDKSISQKDTKSDQKVEGKASDLKTGNNDEKTEKQCTENSDNVDNLKDKNVKDTEEKMETETETSVTVEKNESSNVENTEQDIVKEHVTEDIKEDIKKDVTNSENDDSPKDDSDKQNQEESVSDSKFGNKNGADSSDAELDKKTDEVKEGNGVDENCERIGNDKLPGNKNAAESKVENNVDKKCETIGTGTGEKEEEVLIEWDDEDDYLLHLEDILKTIHTTFYKFHDQLVKSNESEETNDDSAEKPSLKNLIPYIKRKVLSGCNIVFSGVIPTNMAPEKSRAYIVAKALGANIHTEFKTKENEKNPQKYTTHLVAARGGTLKVRTAMSYKHINKVNADWLWSSAERWDRVEEVLFPISDLKEGEQGRDSPDIMEHQKVAKVASRKRPHGSGHNSNKPKSKRTKRTKGKDIDEDEAEDGNNKGGKKSDNFSLSYNPMLAFSDDDLAYMDKEVEDEMDNEEEIDDDEDDELRDCRIRNEVLKKTVDLVESSSDDSMCADLPRGWGLRKKMSPKSSSSEDEMIGSNSPERIDISPEYDSETDQDKFEKIMDAFGPETENSDEEYAESIGSVDEEIADAVMKEFLS